LSIGLAVGSYFSINASITISAARHAPRSRPPMQWQHQAWRPCLGRAAVQFGTGRRCFGRHASVDVQPWGSRGCHRRFNLRAGLGWCRFNLRCFLRWDRPTSASRSRLMICSGGSLCTKQTKCRRGVLFASPAYL